ncbi:hypothetical protein BKA82DRAFT_4100289, partial [Pisolithus tinctorius]
MKYSTHCCTVLAQSSTWCGKNYMPNQTVVPPGGQFVLPPRSEDPLLAFRCAPAFRPYLEEDAKNATFVVDTRIVYDWISGASPVTLPAARTPVLRLRCGNVTVVIEVGGLRTTHEVPLNATGYEVPLDISKLNARRPLTTTGSLWVRPVNSPGSPFQPFVPQGFYVSFDPYLLKNLSYIDQLKDDGMIPPYDNATVFEQVLNRTVELGLYVIFDMRSYYQNLTAVAELVNTYKSLPNLLTWETAHEPDGNSDPLMDGYHPIGIVLNCEDYDFTPYVEGADIVLEDAYPIGINATYSLGGLIDIKARIQTYKDRLDILGYDRTRPFPPHSYWTTIPTGAQWAAIGLISSTWSDRCYPTTTGNSTTIEGTAMILTNIITEYVQPYLVRPQVAYSLHSYGSVDAGVWYDGTSYLLIAANVNGTETFVPWGSLGLGKVTNATAQVQAHYSVGQPFNDTGLTSTPTGVGIY